MSVLTLVQFRIVTADFHDLMNSPVIFGSIRVKNPFNAAYVCGLFQEAITSQHIFEPILARSHLHVIFVEGALPDLMRRKDTPKSMLEPGADGRQRRRLPLRQQLQQQLLLPAQRHQHPQPQDQTTITRHLVAAAHHPNLILDTSSSDFTLLKSF